MHATEDPGDEDLLVCGTCQRDFPLKKITTFMQHKKFDCDDQLEELDKKSSTLLCQSCPEQFGSPWRLLKHAQGVHSLRIYQEQGRIIQEQLELAVPRIPDVKWESDTSGLLLSAQPRPLQKTVSQIVLPSSVAAGSTPWRQSVLTADKANMINKDDLKNQECRELKKNDKTPDPNSPELDTCRTDQPLSVVALPADDTATTSEQSAMKQEAEAEDEQICCDDQNCGITLMPLTHEGLKKCCSAVLPKKRKRHMEIKHLTSVARSRLKKYSSAMKRRAQPPATQTAPSIYIDLEPHNETSEKQPRNEAEQMNTDQFRPTTSGVSAEITTSSNYVSATTTRTLPMTQKSVIIQPGSTFSIPVPYSIGSQPLIAFTTHHGDAEYVSSSVSSTVGPALLSAGRPAPATVNTGPSSVATQMPMTKELLKKETKQLQLPASASEARRDLNNASPTDPSSGRGKKRRYPTSRPYKCDQCDNAFNQRIHLKKHQSKHTGVKPYKCEQCDYSTVERSHLKVHIRVHTGEKPFRCTYCEYATAQNSTLKIHLKRHHNYNLSYSCETCGKKFAEEELYQNHTKEHQTTAGAGPEAGQARSGSSPQEVSLLTSETNFARSQQPSQLAPWTTSPLSASLEGAPPETLHLAIPITQQQGHSASSSVSHSPVTVEENSTVVKSAGTDLPTKNKD